MASETRHSHGSLYDNFPDRPQSLHGGAQFDQGFRPTPDGQPNRGPLNDSGYRANDGPNTAPGLLSCPACGWATKDKGSRWCPRCPVATRLIDLAEQPDPQPPAGRLPSDALKSHSLFAVDVRKDFGAGGDATVGGQTVTVQPDRPRPSTRHVACPQCGHEFAMPIPAKLQGGQPLHARAGAGVEGKRAHTRGLDVAKIVDDGSPLAALKASLYGTYGIGSPVAKEVTAAESAIQGEYDATPSAGATGAASVYCPECRQRIRLTDEGRCPDCNMVLGSHEHGRTAREKGDGNGSAEDSSKVAKLAPDDDGSALWALKQLNARQGISDAVAKVAVERDPLDDGSPAFALAQMARAHYGVR